MRTVTSLVPTLRVGMQTNTKVGFRLNLFLCPKYRHCERIEAVQRGNGLPHFVRNDGKWIASYHAMTTKSLFNIFGYNFQKYKKGNDMRTVTLKISDAYFDNFMAFLQMLPKKAVQFEQNTKSSEVKKIQSYIEEAMSDVTSKRSRIVRVIK